VAAKHSKVVAVKKLVVGFWNSQAGLPRGEYWLAAPPLGVPICSLLQWVGNSECLTKAYQLFIQHTILIPCDCSIWLLFSHEK